MYLKSVYEHNFGNLPVIVLNPASPHYNIWVHDRFKSIGWRVLNVPIFLIENRHSFLFVSETKQHDN